MKFSDFLVTESSGSDLVASAKLHRNRIRAELEAARKDGAEDDVFELEAALDDAEQELAQLTRSSKNTKVSEATVEVKRCQELLTVIEELVDAQRPMSDLNHLRASLQKLASPLLERLQAVDDKIAALKAEQQAAHQSEDRTKVDFIQRRIEILEKSKKRGSLDALVWD